MELWKYLCKKWSSFFTSIFFAVDIEPQLVMEETLHSQAYQILLAVREKGITMKKLAEILCIPHYMARSVIRFFDTNKIGRLISVDYLKQKVQKWVFFTLSGNTNFLTLIKMLRNVFIVKFTQGLDTFPIKIFPNEVVQWIFFLTL